jgi:two-component system, OmpR family, KDP operon response regulator KdpE
MLTDPVCTPLHVLVIDDEPQIRRFLDIALRAQNYQVSLAANGRAGLVELATRGADLVVLDIGLPDLEGGEVLRQIREFSHVPVIMLSVRSGESEKVAMLDAGANDYVTKPFGMQELMARIRALLRQSPSSKEEMVCFDDGHLRIDLARREVKLDGKLQTLSRKEYALLVLLLKHAGRVVTQPQILRDIWGASHSHDTHYVRILLGKLRQKLADNPLAPRYIVTEPGVGLRFVAKPEVD